MKYGEVEKVVVWDGDSDASMAEVEVTFRVSRSVLFEFIDALKPISPSAKREPIRAILDYSSELGAEVES